MKVVLLVQAIFISSVIFSSAISQRLSKYAVYSYLPVPDFTALLAQANSSASMSDVVSNAVKLLSSRSEQLLQLFSMLDYFGQYQHEGSADRSTLGECDSCLAVRYVMVSNTAASFLKIKWDNIEIDRVTVLVQGAFDQLRRAGLRLLFVHLGDTWSSWRLNALFHMNTIFQVQPSCHAALFLAPTAILLADPFPTAIVKRVSSTESKTSEQHAIYCSVSSGSFPMLGSDWQKKEQNIGGEGEITDGTEDFFATRSTCDLSAFLSTSAQAVEILQTVLLKVQRITLEEIPSQSTVDNELHIAQLFHRAALSINLASNTLQGRNSAHPVNVAAALLPLEGYHSGIIRTNKNAVSVNTDETYSGLHSSIMSQVDKLFVSNYSLAKEKTSLQARVLTMPEWSQPRIRSIHNGVNSSYGSVRRCQSFPCRCELQYWIDAAHIPSMWSFMHHLLNARIDSCRSIVAHHIKNMYPSQIHYVTSINLTTHNRDQRVEYFDRKGVYQKFESFKMHGESLAHSFVNDSLDGCHLMWTNYTDSNSQSHSDYYDFHGVLRCSVSISDMETFGILTIAHLNSIPVFQQLQSVEKINTTVSNDGQSLHFQLILPLKIHLLTMQGNPCGKLATFMYIVQRRPLLSMASPTMMEVQEYLDDGASMISSFSSTICVEPRFLRSITNVRNVPVLWDGFEAVNVTMTLEEKPVEEMSLFDKQPIGEGSVTVRIDRRNRFNDDSMQRTYNYSITPEMARQAFFNESHRFVFISGNHHSGTTILRKILGNDFQRASITPREAWPQPYLVYDQNKPVQLFKLPVTQDGEAFYVFDAILQHISHWRVVFLVRDLRDVMYSLQVRHSHVQPQFLYRSVVACWIRAAQLALMLKPLRNVLLVRYEDLFDAPSFSTLQHIFEFVGLEFDLQLVLMNSHFVAPVTREVVNGTLVPFYPNFRDESALTPSKIVSYRYQQIHENFTQRSGKWATSPYAHEITDFLRRDYPKAIDYLGMFGYL